MITISVMGLDPFICEHYSAAIHKRLPQLFGCAADELIVYAPESFLFHNGVDQTSWHTIVHVHAPSKYREKQARVAAYILRSLKDHIVHGAVEFYYFEEGDRYEAFDETYPRFVTAANEVALDEPEEEAKDVYLGDVFADVALEQPQEKRPKRK